jgi:hypothetical protein
MKELAETISLALLVCLVLGLFFLFSGSPDVWDKWHDRAMQAGECKPIPTAPPPAPKSPPAA